MGTYKMTVTPTQDATPTVRVVEARNKAGAVAHVAKDTITAEAIDTAEAMDLAAKGMKLERANGGE